MVVFSIARRSLKARRSCIERHYLHPMIVYHSSIALIMA
jgi:hypothetical protein